MGLKRSLHRPTCSGLGDALAGASERRRRRRAFGKPAREFDRRHISGKGLQWMLVEAMDLRAERLSPEKRERFDAVMRAQGGDR